MAFNINSLTLGEVDTIETLTGASIDSIGDDGRPKGKMLAALVYVVKRREDREYTFNQAQTVTLSEAEDLIDFDEDTPNLPAPQDHLPKKPNKPKSKTTD